MDESQLEAMWRDVFRRVPRDAVRAICQRIFVEIDTRNEGRIGFNEFLDYLAHGMHTNLGAQRDRFYRSGHASDRSSGLSPNSSNIMTPRKEIPPMSVGMSPNSPQLPQIPNAARPVAVRPARQVGTRRAGFEDGPGR